MRVRIRKSIFEQLQEVAEEETERTGEHVTVSDLVRVACYNYLLIHNGIRELENLPEDEFEEEEDDWDADEEEDDEEDEEDQEPVIIVINPMLR
jgi:hypothetical protein